MSLAAPIFQKRRRAKSEAARKPFQSIKQSVPDVPFLPRSRHTLKLLVHQKGTSSEALSQASPKNVARRSTTKRISSKEVSTTQTLMTLVEAPNLTIDSYSRSRTPTAIPNSSIGDKKVKSVRSVELDDLPQESSLASRPTSRRKSRRGSTAWKADSRHRRRPTVIDLSGEMEVDQARQKWWTSRRSAQSSGSQRLSQQDGASTNVIEPNVEVAPSCSQENFRMQQKLREHSDLLETYSDGGLRGDSSRSRNSASSWDAGKGASLSSRELQSTSWKRRTSASSLAELVMKAVISDYEGAHISKDNSPTVAVQGSISKRKRERHYAVSFNMLAKEVSQLLAGNDGDASSLLCHKDPERDVFREQEDKQGFAMKLDASEVQTCDLPTNNVTQKRLTLLLGEEYLAYIDFFEITAEEQGLCDRADSPTLPVLSTEENLGTPASLASQTRDAEEDKRAPRECKDEHIRASNGEDGSFPDLKAQFEAIFASSLDLAMTRSAHRNSGPLETDSQSDGQIVQEKLRLRHRLSTPLLRPEKTTLLQRAATLSKLTRTTHNSSPMQRGQELASLADDEKGSEGAPPPEPATDAQCADVREAIEKQRRLRLRLQEEIFETGASRGQAATVSHLESRVASQRDQGSELGYYDFLEL